MDYYNAVDHLIKVSAKLKTANNTAYIENSRSITFDELFNKALRFGDYLTSRYKIKPGKYILVDLPDSINFVISFLGMVSRGIVPIIINNAMSKNEICHIITSSSPCLIITDNPLKFLSFNVPIAPYIEVDGGPYPQKFKFRTTGESVAFYVCSSGTTDKPKLIAHNHKSIFGTGDVFAEILNINSKDIILSAAKCSHAYGLGNSIFIPLSRGAATILINEAATPEKITDMAIQHRATIFFGVPRHYASLLKIKSNIPKSIRKFVSAGESLPMKLYTQWKKQFHTPIINAVGSTETLGFVLYSRSTPDKLEPTPFTKVKIKANKNVGELLVFTPYISLQSHKWLSTNDIYEKTNNTFRYIGRKDNVVKINGIYFPLANAEARINEVEGVEQAVIIQTKNNFGLPRLVILVKLNKNVKLDYMENKIAEVIRNESVIFKRPFTIKIVDNISYTTTGKIKRQLVSGAI